MPKKFIKPKELFEQLKLALVFDDSQDDEIRPACVQSYFIGWDRPILESSIAFLAHGWNKRGALDLSSKLVVVPTRHAGRRLREALAIEASHYKAAVLPPLVVTPNFLTDPERLESLDAPAPDQAMTKAIWTAALLDLDLDKFRCVFPVDPVDRNLAWATHTASELLAVRELLCREGLSFNKACRSLGAEQIESERWRELARLEKLVVERTRKQGYTDPMEATHLAANTINLPPDVKQITVLGCSDLPGLASQTLEEYSRTFPVDIVIAAPETHCHAFDRWGNPLPEVWLKSEIDLPNTESTIQSAANPGEQAELVAELVAVHHDPASTVAIGVPDPETIAPIEQLLGGEGYTTHDPSGKPLNQHSVYYLLELTHQLIDTESFDAFRQLIRIPEWLNAMLKSIENATDTKVSRDRFVSRMDKLALETLPDSLSDARFAASHRYWQHQELELGINWVREWSKKFKNEAFDETLIAYLVEIFEKKVIEDDDSSRFSEVANHLMESIEIMRETESVFTTKLSAADRFDLLLELIKDRSLYPERSALNIDLEGWVELPWEDAPHIILTGMNDSCVPEAIVSHSFLPDSARKFLGMMDNDRRFARDAYHLTLMTENRRNSGGRIDFIFGRQTNSGDPLRPSRLLFQCKDEELAERTLQFFTVESKESQPVPWHLAWQLRPSRLEPDHRLFRRISVTAFRSYLACPFRFYLRYGLDMEEMESGKSEMNAMEFGNLIHDTLEAFGKDPEASLLTDRNQIRDFFYQQLDHLLNLWFGKHWTTPVVIQREAARQRLSWWSKVEAEQRRDGWRILDPESQIGSDESPFKIGGMQVRGRIDRIEFHPQFGYRVFDFKTMSPGEKSVVDFHVTPIKRSENSENFPEWSLVTNESGRLSRWTDLQLPLYRLALEERFPGEKISVGYVTLGRTKKEVGISMWENIEDKYLKSAEQCAIGVIESIGEHRFWPPTERPQYSDALEELFFGDPSTAVDSSALTGWEHKQLKSA